MPAFEISALGPLGWFAIGAIAVVTIAWLSVSF